MIYLIIDVHYEDNAQSSTGVVAGIRFSGIEKNTILSEHTTIVNDIQPYESGQFYKREMPCILALLKQIKQPYDVIVIDGYVYLDGKQQKGLGGYLYDTLEIKKPIVGIAKNKFHAITDEYAVKRGKSKHPLYVTCVDADIKTAIKLVHDLEGEYRLPRIIKDVDKLSRCPVRTKGTNILS